MYVCLFKYLETLAAWYISCIFMLSVSHSNLKCMRLGRDTTNGLRSTWQVRSHPSHPDPSTHRLIRPLTPKGWIREANCSATSKWAGSNAKSGWHNSCAKSESESVLFFWNKKERKLNEQALWPQQHCTSHGSAFLRHRADCCVASQGKTMTWDSKFGSWCFFIHVTCLMQLR